MPAWLQRLGLIAIVSLIVGAFVVTGVQQQGAPGAGVAATVRGEDIPRERFEWVREQTEQALAPELGELGARERREIVDAQTHASLVRRYLLAQEAEALGLEVHDDELQRDLWENPQFRQEDGRYSRELVEILAERSGLGMRGLADEYRRDILLRKFRRLVEAPVRVSRAAARWDLLRQDTSVVLRYARAAADRYRARVELEPGAPAQLAASDPERVRARYEAQIGDFRRPEEVRARHILFAGDGARERAAQARAEIAGGADFEALARERSEDSATRERAGDLGWFPRGLMVEGFDDAAFSLDPGELSDPVETEFGVHLVRVEERREALDTPFEAVRESLAREILVEDEARALAETAARYVLDRAREGMDFGRAARDVDLAATLTVPFRLADREIPGLPGSQELHRAAFDLGEERPLAPRVFGADGVYYAAVLERRERPGAEEIDAELPEAVERLTDAERDANSTLWYRSRLDQAYSAGAVERYDTLR